MENWAWGGGRIAGKSKNAQKSIIWPGTWPNIFFGVGVPSRPSPLQLCQWILSSDLIAASVRENFCTLLLLLDNRTGAHCTSIHKGASF